MNRKAVLLDRDGTLIVDRGYLNNPDDIEFLNGAIRALAVVQQMGFELIVVTNQSGIGRGKITMENVEATHLRINELLEHQGITIRNFYYCPHSPAQQCLCRKPKPGLLLQAMTENNIDPKMSYMVGDKWSDVQAGFAAGVTPVFLSKQVQPMSESLQPLIVVPSLLDFSIFLKKGGLT